MNYDAFSPICCVVGHVDVGKTKLLDYLRNSMTKEISGITQQLGATYYNKDALDNIINNPKNKLNINGLIIIDTPGHECFTTMRMVGCKISHMAILIIDVVKGLEKSTIESINILKTYQTDFVIALNKIDKINGWIKCPAKNLKQTLEKQKKQTLDDLKKYVNHIICQLAEHEINAQLYYENTDYKTFVSMVPVSASSGEGISDLVLLISKLIEKKKKELIKTNLFKYMHGYVLDQRQDNKFGSFYMMVNSIGTIKEGDMIKINNNNYNVKYLLTVDDQNEMKDKSNFKRCSEITGTHGFGLILDNDVVLNPGDMYIDTNCQLDDEALSIKHTTLNYNDYYIEDNVKEQDIKLNKYGLTINIPSKSILSAMVKMFSDDNIPIANYSIGRLTKDVIIKAKTLSTSKDKLLNEKYELYRCILIFDPIVQNQNNKLDDDLIQLMNNEKVILIKSNTIYKLKELYQEYYNKIKTQIINKYIQASPFKLNIIPKYIFLTSSPLLFGVKVIEGSIKKGIKIFAYKDNKSIELGVLSGIHKNKVDVDEANKNDEVCIRVENDIKRIKYGDDFDHTYVLQQERSDSNNKITQMLQEI